MTESGLKNRRKEMYQKTQLLITLENSFQKLQSEYDVKENEIYKSVVERKRKISESFFESIHSNLKLKYKLELNNSAFTLRNEEFKCSLEIKLNDNYNYSKGKTSYNILISQSAWFSSFQEFSFKYKDEKDGKKEVAKYFFLQDYLTLVEYVATSNLESQLIDLQLELLNSIHQLNSICKTDLQNLQGMINLEKERIISNLVEKATEVRWSSEVERDRASILGFKILHRTPKKLVIKKFNKDFQLPEGDWYKETIKKEELRYYIKDTNYSILTT